MNTQTGYKIQSIFLHYRTKEKLYRVKRIYKSGGLDYIVCNEKILFELKIIKEE